MDKSLTKMPKLELKNTLEELVQSERKITAQVLEYLAEVDRRRAYLDWGFNSLYEYLTVGLGYSGSAAYRRMEGARALRQVPEIKKDLEDGSLNLSQIAMAQAAIKHEQKVNGPVSAEEKKQVFNELRNMNTADTQKVLDRNFDSPPPVASVKHKQDDSVQVSMTFSKEEFEIMIRVRQILSHSIPSGNWNEVVIAMAKDLIKRRDPLAKKTVEAQQVQKQSECSRHGGSLRKTKTETSPKLSIVADDDLSVSETDKNLSFFDGNNAQNRTQEAGDSPPAHVTLAERKPISAPVRRAIFQRDQCCQHRNENGSLCKSRHQLEIDHIHPIFAGGSDELSNLRLLCRIHNADRYRRQAGISAV